MKKKEIMKKEYMAPAIRINDAELGDLLQASITQVGGNSGIGLGDGDAPAEADARYGYHSVWDDEE